MLSRTQPRPADAPDLSLAEIQNPMIDAYLAALPEGREPRILASRTVFVADDRKEALRFAESRAGAASRAPGRDRAARPASGSLDGMIAAIDVHLGTPDEVIASLQADSALARVDGRRGPGAFDRSAASLHPAIDRAGRRGGGAGARLGTRCGGTSGASRDHRAKDDEDARDGRRRHRRAGRDHAGIPPGRDPRPATRGARPRAGDYRALFAPASPGAVTAPERFAVGAFVAGLHGDAAIAAFYAARPRRERGLGGAARSGRRRHRGGRGRTAPTAATRRVR